jgi:hypothetical protein
MAKIDPVSKALANAPLEDEPISEAEEQAVRESKEWFARNPGISNEEILKELTSRKNLPK